MHKKRIDALIGKLPKNNIDALLVTKPENIFYLTSFLADRVVIVVNAKKNFAVTDFIYEEAASKYLSGFEIFTAKDKSEFLKTISLALDKFKIKKLGFEAPALNFAYYKTIKRAVKKKELVATEDIVESMREIKEKKEISALKRALKITEGTFKEVKKRLRSGITELEVSRRIKETFMKKGADGYPFEPIVATQPSSSQPHYLPGAKRLGRNKFILLDFGAKLGGYNSDLTRMCALGKITPKFKKLYNIIIAAQKRAIERIRPGVKIRDIDLAARQYIARKGFGKYFGHNLGHGIGLEIHERPVISSSNKGILKEGMVFTVEPGIYLPGYGGLRIEDMVLVTKKGCEVLTDDIDKSI
jgi:Xaa-Pro aminopeptidase